MTFAEIVRLMCSGLCCVSFMTLVFFVLLIKGSEKLGRRNS